MAVVATGYLQQAQCLSYLVAGSSTFRSVVSATDFTEALNFIHYPYAEDSVDQWPRAVISQDGSVRGQKMGVGTWYSTGTLTLTLQFVVPPEYQGSVKDKYNWMCNKSGAIIKEMEALAATGQPIATVDETYLNMTGWSVADGPWFMSADEMEIEDPETSNQVEYTWITFDIEHR